MNHFFAGQIGLEEGAGIGASVADYNLLIGGIRFRQLRVGKGSCKRWSGGSKSFVGGGDLDCYGAYDVLSHSNAPYGPDDNPEQWQATAANPLARPTTGKLATYPSGGFILDFELDYTNVTRGIRDMEEQGWVDDATRVVFIEFLAYNPNVNLFNNMQIIFEYSAGGLAYPWARFLTPKL